MKRKAITRIRRDSLNYTLPQASQMLISRGKAIGIDRLEDCIRHGLLHTRVYPGSQAGAVQRLVTRIELQDFAINFGLRFIYQ